ncbi:MAG: N-acetyl sugar amidotransferase [Bacteroidetes bacterium]|nr:N-acetyl sugar amidotransferase [Bacteroidota bacterium]
MIKKNKNQICTRCVMDTTDPFIVFDENGNCNHCTAALKKVESVTFSSDNERENALNTIITKIKNSGEGNKYDCIIGLSGGVDSSYLAYVVKKLGLRPLAIHVDNGWNSELAVKNIENILKKLNIDLYTHVIDWEVFKSLQLAFLKASVIDLEMLSDNAIVIGIYNLSKKFKIKYFIDGTNYAAESIMPGSWFYVPKYDSLNIRSIYKRFGSGKKLTTYPLLNLVEYVRFRYFKKGESIALLNYVPYEKAKAMKILVEELEWKDYGGKHFESKITHFYQAYILPTKFNVDKRKAHLSSLICSGQLSRNDALNELKKELYNPSVFEDDKEYFIKKLGLTIEEFDKIMSAPVKEHHDYPAYQLVHKKLRNIFRKFFPKRVISE